MLNSISSINGLYSAINFIIAILSFSFPTNFPPSFFGLNVHTTLLRSFLIISNVSGICSIFRKSNLISTKSDFERAIFNIFLVFAGVCSAMETHVLYFIFLKYIHQKLPFQNACPLQVLNEP